MFRFSSFYDVYKTAPESPIREGREFHDPVNEYLA